MIRYGYNQQITPPAPFVHVTIRCPETGNSVDEVPAQLDSAADRTVIPGRLLVELGLVPLDELRVVGFGGQVFVLPTYRVELGIRGMVPAFVEVIVHETASGKGVEKSETEAARLLRLAAAQGHKAAQKELDGMKPATP